MNYKHFGLNRVDIKDECVHANVNARRNRFLNERKPTLGEILKNTRSVTYSTFFDHSGGLLKVMNTQLVKIVHIMIMLNTVEQSQGSKGHQCGSTHPPALP